MLKIIENKEELQVIEVLNFEDGNTVNIYYCDMQDLSPRDHECIGDFYALHSYIRTLNEADLVKRKEYFNWDDHMKDIKKQFPGSLVIPIFMYDHSYIALRTVPYSCLWDCAQLGFALVTPARIRNYFGVKRSSERLRDTATHIVEHEVEEYGKWLNGETFGGQMFNKDGKMISEAWGFIGKDWADNGLIDCLENNKIDQQEIK